MKILTGFVAICIIFLQTRAEIKTEKHEISFPNKEIVFDHRSFINEKIAYATCGESSDPTILNCDLNRQKSKDSQETYSCNISIKANYEKGKLSKKFQVVPFGDNKVILVIAEMILNGEQDNEAFIDIKTIEMEDCKVNEIRYPVEAWFLDHMDPTLTTVVVPYDMSFDVFYPNTKLCSQQHCRVTIDKDGKAAKGPIKSIDIVLGRGLREPVVPIQIGTPDKGLLFVDMKHLYGNGHYEGQLDLSILHPNGTKATVDSFRDLDIQSTVVSTAHNIISLCSKRSNITCLQYDSDHKLKLNVTFPKYVTYRTYLIKVQNLPGGGFLLLLGKRRKSNENMLVDLFVIKVDETGKEVGTVTINAPDCDMELHRYVGRIEEKENQKYCVSLACYTFPYIPKSQTSVDVGMDCFNNDFEKLK